MKSLLWVVVCCSPFVAHAQDACLSSSPTLEVWVNCRLEQIAAARINQRDGTTQTESPAASSGSTSLVDQSSAPDLGALSLALASLGGAGGGASGSPFSFTATPYALLAARSGKALDPQFYNHYRDWRRLSFTIGREQDDEQHDGPANIFAGKYLIVNHRDASAPSNQRHIQAVADAIKPAAVNFSQTIHEITDYLFAALGPIFGLDTATPEARASFLENQLSDRSIATTLALLKGDQVDHIDGICAAHIDPEVSFSDTTTAVIEEIRRAPQLALSFLSKIRTHGMVDDYRAELIWDYGLYRRLDWTANVSYDYRNFAQVGGDIRGARFAQQFQYQLTREVNLRQEPWKIAFSTEGKWQTKVSPTYELHGKLTVPIVSGVSLPVSVSWATRTDLIKEAFIKGSFGLSFDISKLALAFQRQ